MKFDRLYAWEGISALDSHLDLWWWQHAIMQNIISSPGSLPLPEGCTSYSLTPSPLQKEEELQGGRQNPSAATALSEVKDTMHSKENSAVQGIYMPQPNWSPVIPVPGRLHPETHKQNSSVPFSEKRHNTSFGQSSLLFTASLTLLPFKPGGEIPMDSLKQILKLPTCHSPSLWFTYPTPFSLGKCYLGYHSWMVIYLAGSWQ